jgi:hypothetical protein
MTKEERDDLTLDEKEELGCRCMGLNALRETSCKFPGLGEFYDAAIDQPEPVEPADIGDPPAEPELPQPAATYRSERSDRWLIFMFLQTPNKTKEIQDLMQSVDAYQNKADQYADDMEAYLKDKATWEINRNAAVSKAEGSIDLFYKNFGWAFMDKGDKEQYYSRILATWATQGLIIAVNFVLILFFIYRKDRAR